MPFYFAWVDPTDNVFDPTRHNVEDEKIIDFEMDHSEGDFATFTLNVKNPKIGLLNPGRKVWAWFALDEEPIFFGRLIGIPSNLISEVCTLSLIAKPLDYVFQKQAIAESLKVEPYYDPMFMDLAARDDPDAIISSYSKHYHIDRLTHVVTASDVLVGEDGVEVFEETESFRDSVVLELKQTPLRKVLIQAQVQWTQHLEGNGFVGAFEFDTYAGEQMVGAWPQDGASLGGGWTAFDPFGGTSTGGVVPKTPMCYDLYQADKAKIVVQTAHTENKESEHTTGDTLSSSRSDAYLVSRAPTLAVVLSAHTSGGELDENADPPINTPQHVDETIAYCPRSHIVARLGASYKADNQRFENCYIEVDADVQSILTLPESPGEPDWETITVTGQCGAPIFSYDFLTDQPIDPASLPGFVRGFGINFTIPENDPTFGGQPPLGDFLSSPGDLYVPIGNLGSSNFFAQDRGNFSIRYLITLARSHLLIRSRAVEITFDCTFSRAMELTLRKSAQIFDDRLPGGQAVGKIVKYVLKGDGATGAFIGTVTIGCAIGFGSEIVVSDGDDEYCDDGYDDDYEFMTDGQIDIGTGDITYTPPRAASQDVEAFFTAEIVGSAGGQVGLCRQAMLALATPDAQSDTITFDDKTSVYLQLGFPDMNAGPFSGDYNITCSKLVMPQGINLEADIYTPSPGAEDSEEPSATGDKWEVETDPDHWFWIASNENRTVTKNDPNWRSVRAVNYRYGSDKRYFEIHIDTPPLAQDYHMIGIAPITGSNPWEPDDYITIFDGVGVQGTDNIRVGDSFTVGTVGTLVEFAIGDVAMVAVDLVNGNIWFGRNGVWFAGDPGAGTSPQATFVPVAVGFVVPCVSCYNTDGQYTLRTLHSSLAHTPPDGFIAWN